MCIYPFYLSIHIGGHTLGFAHCSSFQNRIDLQGALTELKGDGQTTVDELREINLGTEEEPRPTFISASLTAERAEELKALLCEYKDCFA